LEIEHTYFLRKKTGEFFPLRLWLMRYSNWVIVMFSCFKPIKLKKLNKKKYLKQETHALNPYLRVGVSAQRIKLLYLFLKVSFFKKYNYGF
jgi:hypothetical protein